jgi:hypothetical protein
MILIPCIQGSEEWLRARMSRPTASEFERIITPKKWQASSSAREYAIFLLTELILDQPLSGITTAAMEHGHATEPKAISAYEMLAGRDVELCGFCTTDDGLVGASPDGLVGDDGSVEMKSPWKPEVHVGYLLKPETLVAEYFVQVQGQLYVTERKWTDLVSYFSGMPMVQVRCVPHPEFQVALKRELDIFVRDLSALIDLAKERGWIKEHVKRESMPSKDWLTDADVDAILAQQRAAKQ